MSLAITRDEQRFLHTEPDDAPTYIPSPTADDFIHATMMGDEGRFLILQGNRGSGKTTCVLWALVTYADKLRKAGRLRNEPLIVACVRDTFENILRTTIESIKQNQRKGLPVEWKNGYREAIISFNGTPLVHLFFFGLDVPSDVDKLQGFTCGVLWLEEVAPAAGFASGVPVEALGIGATSVRQERVPRRILVSVNPGDRDAWIYRAEEILGNLGLDSLRVARFEMGMYEKSDHFRALAASAKTSEERAQWTEAAEAFEGYLEWNEAFLRASGRLDLVSRLVYGEIGEVQAGEPVVTTFVRALHVVGELVIYPTFPILRLFDGGGSPSTVICQPLGVDGQDGLNILASHCSPNTPLQQHIGEWVIPTMGRLGIMPTGAVSARDSYNRRRLKWEYRDIVDPSMLHEGGTVKAENTSGLVIQEMLGAVIEPGPVDWDSRREALNACFYRPGKGERAKFIQIEDEENEQLVLALAGRFRYPKNIATGTATLTVEAAKRVSGIYSGPPDALAYGLATLYPAYEILKRNLARQAPAVPPARKSSWLAA